MKSQYPAKVELVKGENGRVTLKIWGARAFYANVNKPRPATANSRGGYDCEFLVPKDAPGALEAVKEIMALGTSAFPGSKWKCAIVSNPDKEIAAMEEMGQVPTPSLKQKAGNWVFKANAGIDHPPSVAGTIYSGCYAGAVIGVAKYDVTDKITGAKAIGIKGFLNGAQFHGDGERLGGGTLNVMDELGVPTPHQALPSEDDFTAGLPGYEGQSATAPSDDLPF